jgi:hypothetical protein
LFLAKGIEASVKMTAPALPRDLAITQSALILATCSTLVVTLVKSLGRSLGPGDATACQPTSGMRAALAWAT